jgi:hypothetical protein
MIDSVDLFETGDHEVSTDGDPDLGFDGILRSSVKGFYSQVLFDPPEEQFNAPSGLVDCSDCFGSKGEVIGEKDEVLAGVRITVTHPAQCGWIQLLGFITGKPDSLIAAKPLFTIHRSGLANMELKVLFGTNDEETSRLRNGVKALVVHESPVHDINASRFHGKSIEEVHVVERSFCDIDKNWDRSLQCQLGVELDSGLGGAECRPGKHRKAQINGSGIDCVNHLIDVDSIGIVNVEALGFTYQNFGYILIDSPIPVFVCISQVGAGHSSTDTHRVKKRVVSQTSFNVPQAFPEGQLRKDHTEKLVAGAETFTDSRHGVTLQTARKLFGIEHVRNLGENKSASVHPLLRLETAKSGDPFQIEDTLFRGLTSDYQQYAKN